jgi:hypothetical protein
MMIPGEAVLGMLRTGELIPCSQRQLLSLSSSSVEHLTMSKTIDQLQPAPLKDVNVYVPYYRDTQQRNLLPMAIALYQQGSLEGNRTIEGGESIPFVATWHVSSLPADLSRCTLQFDGNSDFSYDMTIINFEFVTHLIEVLVSHKRTKQADFSKGFYRKLLGLEE